MKHAHWMPIHPESAERTDYVGVLREYRTLPPIAVVVTPCRRALTAFLQGAGADGFAQEPMQCWHDRVFRERHDAGDEQL